MRPDRIIVGEVRDAAAIDMLTAMNTGHDGSLSTGHANSAYDMLARLESMVLMGMELPLEAVKKRQIASAVDIIIHLGRLRDGSRKVLEIDEVTGIKDGQTQLNTLYQFEEAEHSEDTADLEIMKYSGKCKTFRRNSYRNACKESRFNKYRETETRGNWIGKKAAAKEDFMKTDYRSYHLSLAETIGCFIVYFIFSAIISLLFYNSFIPVAVFAPFGFYIRKLFQDYRRKQRQKRLYLEFKDMVQALSASLGAGYAFENAFSAAYEEMRKLYGNSGLIVSELKIIIRGIRLNETNRRFIEGFWRTVRGTGYR